MTRRSIPWSGDSAPEQCRGKFALGSWIVGRPGLQHGQFRVGSNPLTQKGRGCEGPVSGGKKSRREWTVAEFHPCVSRLPWECSSCVERLFGVPKTRNALEGWPLAGKNAPSAQLWPSGSQPSHSGTDNRERMRVSGCGVDGGDVWLVHGLTWSRSHTEPCAQLCDCGCGPRQPTVEAGHRQRCCQTNHEGRNTSMRENLHPPQPNKSDGLQGRCHLRNQCPCTECVQAWGPWPACLVCAA